MLQNLLSYDPQNGNFRWKVSRGNVRAGDKAGTINARGYLQIKVYGETHLAHRLAWFFETGEWPSEYVDHINGVKTDNRFSNLREATNSENQFNRGKPSNNTSGHKCVFLQDGKWRVRIVANKKRIHVGYFDNKEQAEAACEVALREYHKDFASF